MADASSVAGAASDGAGVSRLEESDAEGVAELAPSVGVAAEDGSVRTPEDRVEAGTTETLCGEATAGTGRPSACSATLIGPSATAVPPTVRRSGTGTEPFAFTVRPPSTVPTTPAAVVWSGTGVHTPPFWYSRSRSWAWRQPPPVPQAWAENAKPTPV